MHDRGTTPSQRGIGTLDPLTAAEKARGWVEFVCGNCGPIAALSAEAVVACACGRRAHPHRDGERLRPAAVRSIRDRLGGARRAEGALAR